MTQELGTHFLVRTCVDRLAGDGGHTIAAELAETRVKRLHHVDVRDDKGEVSRVTLEIGYCRVTVLPPVGKQKRYIAFSITSWNGHRDNKNYVKRYRQTIYDRWLMKV